MKNSKIIPNSQSESESENMSEKSIVFVKND